MSKVYIFGDSFFMEATQHSTSWPNKLSHYYHVVNAAVGGASIYDIYLQFLKYYKDITKEDVVILGWSDPGRYYLNPEISKTDKISKLYYTHFYNQELEALYQDAIMNDVKRMVKEKELRALFLWSFPTGYWIHTLMDNVDHSNYNYKMEFENEIRPALIYFSKVEAEHCKTAEEIIEFFSNDKRPNHIESQRVHNELYAIAVQFITGKISGKIDLYQRVNNGSQIAIY